jgi:prolyl oligopeptidase
MKVFGIRQRVRAAFRVASTAAALIVAPFGVPCAQGVQPTAGVPLKYPATTRSGQADDLNGVRVPDPFRWLESIAAPEVRNWVAAQNALTESFLARVSRRSEIRDLVMRSWRYSKVSAPFPGGERLFFYENSGLENQAALYVQDKPDVAPRVLIDPNAFSGDGLIAIVDQAASPDGRYLAYAVSTQGSMWRSVRVRDVRSSQDTGDELQGLKDSPLSWTGDARGFFYPRVEAARQGATPNPLAPDGREQVYYHRLGRPQSDDRLMFEAADHPSWRLRANVSDDGQYLVISASYGFGLQNRLFLIDLDNPKRPNLGAPIVKLFDEGDAVYEFVGNSGPLFFIRTTKGAPRARLVAVDINTPDDNHWTTLIRETFDPLVDVRHVDDRLVAHRLHDAHSVLELYGLDGSVRGTLNLPGVGTVTAIHGHGENREFYFSYTSFLQPPAIYRYDLDARNTVPWRETRADTSLAQFETTQLFFTSKDGTRVPMFITARRGIKLDGSHPTLLVGEGAFNVPATPIFSPEIAAWLRLGGIYAVANVRGGGEYGRAWHVAATGTNKQVSFDDFIASAEFLIGQRYTRSSSLAIGGRGAGGLLVGAALTQRPELFGAALIDAGILDMTRFSRFTIGASWMPEFGSPDRPADLRALLAYSPLQGVKADVRYPPLLVTVGDHDDAVTPAHSYKFAAALQGVTNTGTALLRVDSDVGFGPGTPTGKQLALDNDRLAFLVDALHVAR